MKRSGIYCIRNKVNGHIYVGSAINLRQRFYDHKSYLRRGVHHSDKLQKAWTKWGEDNFAFELLEEISNHADLVAAEQKWIEHHSAASRENYNVWPGARSSLGYKHTDEAKKRMAELAKARPPMSDATKAKLSAALKGHPGHAKGYKQSEATIARRVAKLRGQKRTPELRALLSRQKMGNKNGLGHKLSAESRARLSELQCQGWARRKQATMVSA